MCGSQFCNVGRVFWKPRRFLILECHICFSMNQILQKKKNLNNHGNNSNTKPLDLSQRGTYQFIDHWIFFKSLKFPSKISWKFWEKISRQINLRQTKLNIKWMLNFFTEGLIRQDSGPTKIFYEKVALSTRKTFKI